MKKYLLPPLRPGINNFFLSVCFAFNCYIHLVSFYYGAVLLFLSVTASSINILYYRRNFSLRSLIQDDNHIPGCTSPDYPEKKIQNGLKLLGILSVAIALCYITCILFGAPLFESYYETLYFSCLMALITIYPFCWYSLQTADGIAGIIQILFEYKCDNSCEYHLLTMLTWSIYGAWFGAFPIPLDWDRQWQEWPTTCCIGAISGCAGAHLFIGMKTLWAYIVERRRTGRSCV